MRIPIDIFNQKLEYLGHIDLGFIPPLGSILAFRGKRGGHQGKITNIEIDATSESPLVEVEIDDGHITTVTELCQA